MAEEVDPSEILGCTCLQLRKTNRRVTHLFEGFLAPVSLTTGQFGVLANLAWLRTTSSDAAPIRALAERLGSDPTTLSRSSSR